MLPYNLNIFSPASTTPMDLQASAETDFERESLACLKELLELLLSLSTAPPTVPFVLTSNCPSLLAELRDAPEENRFHRKFGDYRRSDEYTVAIFPGSDRLIVGLRQDKDDGYDLCGSFNNCGEVRIPCAQEIIRRLQSLSRPLEPIEDERRELHQRRMAELSRQQRERGAAFLERYNAERDRRVQEWVARGDESLSVPNDLNTVEVWRERANNALVRHHGRHDGLTHALILDGPEMRTTHALLQSGWPEGHIHVANANPKHPAAIRHHSGVHSYGVTSSAFLHSPDVVHWAGVGTFRNQDDVGFFSLVYLDYTSTAFWKQDLNQLPRLLAEPFVVAIKCPFRVQHILREEDRHVCSENTRSVRIGRFDVFFDFEGAVLFKLMLSRPAQSRLSEAFVYRAAGRRTWMCFVLFRSLAPRDACHTFGARSVHRRAEPPQDYDWRFHIFSDNNLRPAHRDDVVMVRQELLLHLYLRHGFEVQGRQVRLTLEELEALPRATFPCLHSAVQDFNTAMIDFFA